MTHRRTPRLTPQLAPTPDRRDPRRRGNRGICRSDEAAQAWSCVVETCSVRRQTWQTRRANRSASSGTEHTYPQTCVLLLMWVTSVTWLGCSCTPAPTTLRPRRAGLGTRDTSGEPREVALLREAFCHRVCLLRRACTDGGPIRKLPTKTVGEKEGRWEG